MIDSTAELLQSLEHVTDEVRRLALVLRQVLEAQQRGERLSDAKIADYLDQLANVDADRERMEERIRQFWAMLGKEQAH